MLCDRFSEGSSLSTIPLIFPIGNPTLFVIVYFPNDIVTGQWLLGDVKIPTWGNFG